MAIVCLWLIREPPPRIGCKFEVNGFCTHKTWCSQKGDWEKLKNQPSSNKLRDTILKNLELARQMQQAGVLGIAVITSITIEQFYEHE